MTVVSNSSPPISLAKIEYFDLLARLFGGANLPGSFETSRSPWIQVKATVLTHVGGAQERSGLGLGELSTLILAKEIGAGLLLLDDLAARKLAQREGSRVQGTIGILEACFRRGYLSDLRERTNSG